MRATAEAVGEGQLKALERSSGALEDATRKVANAETTRSAVAREELVRVTGVKSEIGQVGRTLRRGRDALGALAFLGVAAFVILIVLAMLVLAGFINAQPPASAAWSLSPRCSPSAWASPGSSAGSCPTPKTTEEPDMRAVFVRHGQSTGNVGVPCDDLASIPLTDLGHEQAWAVADAWDRAPDLIVTSPYLRTQQTAALTIARFPGAPVEVWPIQEFTYLQPGRWNGSSGSERRPQLVRYWSEADPAYCDGEGAESFATLLRRAEAALERLAALPSPPLAYVFSHGQFIQAVRAVVTQAHLDDAGKMRGFWREGEPPAVANAERVAFFLEDGRWSHHAAAEAA